MSSYTQRDYSRAVLACKIHITIGRPSNKDYQQIIYKNLLPNCPVTLKDMKATKDIFGPNLGSLKGKTVQ